MYIGAVTLLVPDYDEALAFFVGRLGFALVEDRQQSETKRFVVVAPTAEAQTRIRLAKTTTPEQEAATGNQAGGRVLLFMETDDFARDHAAMQAAGVEFLEPPRREPFGTVALFRDPFGGKWELIGRHREGEAETCP